MELLIAVLAFIIVFAIGAWITIIKDVFKIRELSKKATQTIGIIVLLLVMAAAVLYIVLSPELPMFDTSQLTDMAQGRCVTTKINLSRAEYFTM